MRQEAFMNLGNANETASHNILTLKLKRHLVVNYKPDRYSAASSMAKK